MKEYEKLGNMEPVKSQEPKQPCYFLPHHAVFKETSTTTRSQVVFDESANTSDGLSLNHILQVGPTVQLDLYSIVLRFRTHQVCLTADITKIYRQITVNPQDRDLQRIVWSYPPEEYQLNTNIWDSFSSIFGNTLPQETCVR